MTQLITWTGKLPINEQVRAQHGVRLVVLEDIKKWCEERGFKVIERD